LCSDYLPPIARNARINKLRDLLRTSSGYRLLVPKTARGTPDRPLRLCLRQAFNVVRKGKRRSGKDTSPYLVPTILCLWILQHSYCGCHSPVKRQTTAAIMLRSSISPNMRVKLMHLKLGERVRSKVALLVIFWRNEYTVKVVGDTFWGTVCVTIDVGICIAQAISVMTACKSGWQWYDRSWKRSFEGLVASCFGCDLTASKSQR
jgi:hypothetical protein